MEHLVNPIIFAEWTTWLEWQWERVKKYSNGDFFTWYTMIHKDVDARWELFATYIFAYISKQRPTIEGNAIQEDYAEAVIRNASEYLNIPSLNESVSKLKADGRNPLDLLILPYMGNYIADFPLTPLFGKLSHFLRTGNRVCKFLRSLGKPDAEVRKSFIKEVTQLEMVSNDQYHANMYEQHWMIDEERDGKTSTEFIDFYLGAVNGVVLVRRKGMGHRAGCYIISTRRELTDTKYCQSDEWIQNPDGENYAEYFDFIVNAWVAERTKLTSVGEDTQQGVRRIRNVMAKVSKNPTVNTVQYRYIQVTDEAWKKYKESEAVFKQHSGDCNYTKAFWFRKSHFAQRNGNIYLVSAHWCHRTCTEVSPGPEKQVVEVLV